MAVNTNEIRVITSQAQRNIQNLEGSVSKLNAAFGGLRNLVAGFAIGNFITSTVRMAAALDDVAAASGIALQSVVGFSKAVAAYGGETDGAATGIARLSNFIQSAAEGNLKAQDTFNKLGISLNDLRTMDEEQILRETIRGLDRMGVGAEQTATKMDIFGKSFARVSIAELNRDLDGYISKAGKSSSAIAAAAQAEENFGKAVANVQMILLQALEPLSKLIAAFDPEAIASFAKAIVAAAGTFALFKFAVNPLLSLRGELVALAVEGWTMKEALGKAAGGLAGPFKKLGNDISAVADAFRNTAESGMKGATMLERFGVAMSGVLAIGARLLGWIGILITAFQILDPIIEKITGSGLIEWADKAGAALAGLVGIEYKTEEQKKKLADATAKVNEQHKKEQEETRKVIDALQQQRLALDKMSQAYEESRQKSLAKLQSDVDLIGASERQKIAVQELDNAYQEYFANFSKLRDEYNQKINAGTALERQLAQEMLPMFDQLAESYMKQKAAVQELAAAKASALEQQQLELFQTKERIGLDNQLMELQHQMATSTMSEIEKKYSDIDFAARKSAKAAIEAEAARRNEPLSMAEQQKYYDAAFANLDELKQRTGEQYEQSRLFSTGWQKAFREYADNAKNAAKQAERIFQSVTQNMEDMFVNFAKTGKFEWRSFLNSILEDLLRSQIQQTFAQLFNIGGRSTGNSSGGVLGGIGKLLGFANGGIIPTNQPVVVGERGPELLVGAAGMNVVPNNQLGGQTFVTYNINAVDAMSFKQLVASDPSFIHAVAMQGAKSVPSTRR